MNDRVLKKIHENRICVPVQFGDLKTCGIIVFVRKLCKTFYMICGTQKGSVYLVGKP